MNKEFVPYEEALALKELGFDGECFSHYYRDGDISRTFHLAPITNDCIIVECTAPLYQQAFRWFRKNHGIWYQPHTTKDSNGDWYYFSIEGGPKRTDITSGSDEYEIEELKCLRKLIEIVNQNKDE